MSDTDTDTDTDTDADSSETDADSTESQPSDVATDTDETVDADNDAESDAGFVPSTDTLDGTTVRYLYWAGLVLLVLLAAIATVRFYTSASRAIGIFVAPEFEPVFQAAFNLVVLLLTVTGITLLVRRMTVTQ